MRWSELFTLAVIIALLGIIIGHAFVSPPKKDLRVCPFCGRVWIEDGERIIVPRGEVREDVLL